MKQIEKCNTPEERKAKAVEIGFIKNLNKIKEIDEPAYEEYMNKYRAAVK